jgi:outer membrane lipase/esterase
MKKNRLCISLVTALSSLAVGVSAKAVEFKSIYSLGDSLSDVGTYSNAVVAGAAQQGVALPSIQYRFTDNNPNGSSKVWVENLADRLGLSLVPSRINPVEVGGTAFAEGGARVSNPVGIGYAPQSLITTIPMTTQVDRLLAAKPVLDSGDLVFLWAGANDGFVQFGTINAGGSPTTGLTAMATEAGVVASQVQRLRAAGAKFVVVALLPDLANTPFGALVSQASPQGGQLLSALSSTFNTQAQAVIPSAGAVVVDVNKLLGDVIANPSKYGFNANALGATACGQNPNATGPNDFFNTSLQCLGLNADNFLFADGVHPSAKAHELFGQFAYSGLQAIAQAGALVVAPMVAIRQHGQSLEARLNGGALADASGKLRPLGDIHAYLSSEVGAFDVRAAQVAPAVKADTVKVAAGLDRMVAANALAGLAVSYSTGDTKFGGQSGYLKTTDIIGAAYATIALSPNWYVNASAAFGDIDHNSFVRWWSGGGSNSRPSHCERDALPAELL